MEMNRDTLPPTITISSGPWAGTYARDAEPSATGLYSYWGPTPTAKVRGDDFVRTEYPLPALHFSAHPDDPIGSLHASLDMQGKYAHLYWNTGNWDTQALDTRKWNWVTAVTTTHPNVLEQALGEAAQQIDAHNRPAEYESETYEDEESQYVAEQPAAESDQSLFWVPPEVVVHGGLTHTAYIDEIDGDIYVFAVSDGRSLTIDKTVLEAAAAGTIQLPQSDVWLKVVWADNELPLPDTLFTAT